MPTVVLHAPPGATNAGAADRLAARHLTTLRLAVRALCRRPLFTALATGLLALALAALGAIAAVVNGTLLRPLPYRAPDALYTLLAPEPADGDSLVDLVLSPRLLTRWRAESRAFTGIEGYTPATIKLTGEGEPEPLPGAYVSAGLFDLLGVRPVVGRAFRPADELPGSGVALISHGLWQRRFGGRRDVIGRVVTLDDEPRAIIGVMPERFTLVYRRGDAWTPLALGPQQMTQRGRMIAAIGRLRPGTTAAQGLDDLRAITARLSQELPDEYRATQAKLTPLHEQLFGKRRTGLLVLVGAVGLLLVIAATNLAGLGFADAIARRPATMARLALGASRRSLVAARLTESAIVAAVAVPLGLGGAWLTLAALRATAPDAFAGFGAVRVDWAVALLAAAAALATALLAALPAASREAATGLAGLAGALARTTGDLRERRTRELLLGLQVSVTLVLLVGAALLARNVDALLDRPTGFDARGLHAVEMTVSPRKYATVDARAAYVNRLVAAVRALPGVSGASTTQSRFVLDESMQTFFEVEGKPSPPGVTRMAHVRHVMPDVFRVMRTPVLRGRGIADADRAGAPTVAVVSREFAREYWPGEDPIGKRIRRVVTPPAPWMEVVGVVEDVRDAGIGVALGPTMYVPYLQRNTATARTTLVVRSALPASSLAPALRRAIWSVDRDQTIDAIAPLDALLTRSAAEPRFRTLVVALFGGAALLLVGAGIYAVTLHGVLRRARELGIRAALGARPADLVGDAVWRGLRPVAAGLALGVAAAVGPVYLMQRALKESLGAADAPLFLGVALAVLATAAVVAWLPARRALAIPPSIAMRE
jgi:putative ABC transport system permease protein